MRHIPGHTTSPVAGAMSPAGWLHSAFRQAVASVPNIDVIHSDLLWKSKPEDCRLYLKSRPCSTAEGEMTRLTAERCLSGTRSSTARTLRVPPHQSDLGG